MNWFDTYVCLIDGANITHLAFSVLQKLKLLICFGGKINCFTGYGNFLGEIRNQKDGSGIKGPSRCIAL